MKAVEEPRFHNQLNPTDTEVEEDFEEQKNHVIKEVERNHSVVQAVMRKDDQICAESDPRKGGYPAGY
ncbi:hypothetical protein AMELA_G00284290 [Ameiurus melas]|uniref:Uncharacterized protein n=1 Tax=Ameiurus melas TaxID=219545 RepID=A0A7J5ZI63_AMEME|nr:hypothetical protein AMELA_G00284290 [Ameiurus melas]